MAESISVEGAFNLRDMTAIARLAGYPLKSGMLYRSGFLTGVTPRGQSQLALMGLKRVFDLREPEEIHAMPTICGSGLLITPLRELYPGNFDNSVLMTWGTDLSLEEARRVRLSTYQRMPIEFAPVVKHLFSSLADPDTYPALIHCMGGKDRTGFIAALLLGHLGVDRDTIIKEFVANADQTGAPDTEIMAQLADLYQMSTTGEESRKAMLETLPEQLLAALEVIDHDFGGLERYLIETAGVSSPELERVRSKLIQ